MSKLFKRVLLVSLFVGLFAFSSACIDVDDHWRGAYQHTETRRNGADTEERPTMCKLSLEGGPHDLLFGVCQINTLMMHRPPRLPVLLVSNHKAHLHLQSMHPHEPSNQRQAGPGQQTERSAAANVYCDGTHGWRSSWQSTCSNNQYKLSDGYHRD